MAGVDFTGKWRETRHENKEAMLRKMGVPEEVVPKWLAFTVTMELSSDGDVHCMKLSGNLFGQKKIFFVPHISLEHFCRI